MSSIVAIILSLTFLLLAAFFISFTIYFNKRTLSHKSEIQLLKESQSRSLLRATIETQELERDRISANLHDDLGPLLSVLKYKVSALSKYRKDEVKHLQNISLIKSEIDMIIDHVRRISMNISATILIELGFDEALQQLIHSIQEGTGLIVQYQKNCSLNSLPNQYSLPIYRIIQEGLKNIVSHSKATKISVSIDCSKSINIVIMDNGIGFDVLKTKKGLGIKNIKARVNSVKGKINIQSDKNGTIISLSIPMAI